jgi:hypothetical protein
MATNTAPSGRGANRPAMERVKIRGLAHLAATLLGAWGVIVSIKGLYDLFIGEPEANLYAPQKWAFVTQDQWVRYAGFELVYGLACAGLAFAVWRYARFLPSTIDRERQAPEFQLFD